MERKREKTDEVRKETMKKLWRHVWCARPYFHRGVALWWKRRNETPEERETRIAETNKVFRMIWNQVKRDELDLMPESREMMEFRAELEELMDEILGKEYPQDVLSSGNLHPTE
jgi:hypothetical protein